MRRTWLFITTLGWLALLGCPEARALNVIVRPQAFEIGTFFNGTTLNVEGQVGADQEVVVRFVGVPGDLHLKKKAKVLNLLWMNRGSVDFHGVPNVFVVYLPKPWEALEGEAPARDAEGIRKLSLENLESLVFMEPEGEDKHLLFHELLKLKTKQKLYQEHVGRVHYTQKGQGQRTFQASLAIPARLTEGQYRVEVYAVADGRILDSAIVPVQARLVAAPAFIKNLAFQHPFWHGVLATLVAVVGGLIVGYLFGTSKGSH
ncbi:TIGR02186 family protein [Desulfosoma caldarium]|uniref:Putative transmembrane protein Alph_Pro_TM n=1 Tax=Desulfosoma caldarium TaxID=610254 RepID=A0A3N1VM20_9BACT|nr:TIGR02186 family protein [Desulfosoma caldarium]ROR02990.1 putative transmembrane protein Alph_Pro_TM [Desulfosoma caldarium]